MGQIIRLPKDFIGKADEQRLESLGAHLISNGYATRWRWNREYGIDVAFDIYQADPVERLLVSVRRNRGVFCACDARGDVFTQGPLEQVMIIVGVRARAMYLSGPAP